MQEKCGGWGSLMLLLLLGHCVESPALPQVARFFSPIPCYNDSVGWFGWLSLGSFGLDGCFASTLILMINYNDQIVGFRGSYISKFQAKRKAKILSLPST